MRDVPRNLARPEGFAVRQEDVGWVVLFCNVVSADDVGLSSSWINPFLEAINSVEAIGLLQCAGWMRNDVAIGNEYIHIGNGVEVREVRERKCWESSSLAYVPEEKTQMKQGDLIHQAFKPIKGPRCRSTAGPRGIRRCVGDPEGWLA